MKTGARIPDRAAFAIASLQAQPGDRVAEIGCGSGLALALLLRSETVSAFAVDRSERAVGEARRLHAANIAEGRVEIAKADLADPPPRSFTRVFAVNVNIFWRDPRSAFGWARRWVAPGGLLLLIFDAPTPAQLAQIVEALASSSAVEPFLLEGYQRGPRATLGSLRFRLPG